MLEKKIKVLLTGGGTAGSVSPLLAMAEDLRQLKGRAIDFCWLGGYHGPERAMAGDVDIKFVAISSGKLRRYFSLWNIIDPFLIIIGFIQAFFYLLCWRPKIVLTAGSFIAVPVAMAAFILRIPILVHQQDVVPGLANKIMAPMATVITTVFEKSLSDYGKKARAYGNPVRKIFSTVIPASAVIPAYAGLPVPVRAGVQVLNLKFNNNLPVVLFLGGGTGAQGLNNLVTEAAAELSQTCNMIHLTGRHKTVELKLENYQAYEFLNADQMAAAYAVADLVVSRAGMGVLSELAAQKKSAIIIPMPASHQEANAKILSDAKAAIVLAEKKITAQKLSAEIKKLLADPAKLKILGNNLQQTVKTDSQNKIARLILAILK